MTRQTQRDVEIRLPEGDEPVRVLLVEDDARFVELVRYVLGTGADPRFVVEHAGRLSDALARLARDHIDVLVSDLHLPDSDAMSTVRYLSRAAPDLPLIVLTSDVDPARSLDAIRAGADDYVVKGTLGVQALARLCLFALERRRNLTARLGRGAEEPGRRELEILGRHLLKVADRTNLHLSLLFLRVEGSGGLGAEHRGADRLARLLRVTLRRCDVVARIDTEEVVVVLVMQQPDPHITVSRMARAIMAAGGDLRVRVGVATYDPGQGDTVEDLLARARQDLRPVHS